MEIQVCPCSGKDINIPLKIYGNSRFLRNNMWFYGLINLEDIESEHPRTKEKINKIALEISKNLKIAPISIGSVENGKFCIIDGGHRVGAMRKLGFKYIPAVIDIQLKNDSRIMETKFQVDVDYKPPNLSREDPLILPEIVYVYSSS